jgi:hypothetical protein
MASTPLSTTAAAAAAAPSPDIAREKDSFDLQGLPLELRYMIYEDMHQQEDVRTVGRQLIVRYTPSPARLQRVSKTFASEVNRRLPPNQVHRIEVTQKNMIFLPVNQSWILPEKMLPQGTDALLTMNFNINDGPEDIQRVMSGGELFEWIWRFVDCWGLNSGPSDSAAHETSLPVTLRFWFCSMEAFDEFASDLDVMFYDQEKLLESSKIELMFYEREDHIAYPNKAAVAGANKLLVLTEADGLKMDHEAIKQARRVSKRLLYKKVDPEKMNWNDQSYSDEEGPDQGGDSDGESSGDNEYSGEEDSDLGGDSSGETSDGHSDEEEKKKAIDCSSKLATNPLSCELC